MEKKKIELEATIMKKSIRIVVLNTSIEVLFKLPLVVPPLVNTNAKFYYKDTWKIRQEIQRSNFFYSYTPFKQILKFSEKIIEKIIY